MHHTMLKAKIHRARVTAAELHYEGSCAIDSDLLEIAGIREYEQIHIYNVDNGERFVTYAIRGESGSGVISLNGAAARRAQVGDVIIICAYSGYSEAELTNYKPALVYVDEHNRVQRTRNYIPTQAA